MHTYLCDIVYPEKWTIKSVFTYSSKQIKSRIFKMKLQQTEYSLKYFILIRTIYNLSIISMLHGNIEAIFYELLISASRRRIKHTL